MQLDRVVYDLHERVFASVRPGGKSEFAAGFENTERFDARTLRIGKMKQGEVGQNTIETGIGVWKILRVTFAE